MLSSVLAAYGFNEDECELLPFGSGLINNTWFLKNGKNEYILQRINQAVFKQPYNISANIRAIGDYLRQTSPDYFFVTPIPSRKGEDVISESENYYRLFPFVKNSITFTTVENSGLAFEAAKQFAKFTHLLSGFDPSILKETIPDFHNLNLRYTQFEKSLLQGNRDRILEAQKYVKQLEKYRYIVDKYEQVKHSSFFKKRVMHHDTKISNVLFDNRNKGLCVIDLDTVMSGYFISDVGDMMRTYLSPVNEEEKDFSKIEVREEYFSAIVEGYLSEMQESLTGEEQKNFVYAGEFMIYMQSIRFLSDYFNNDLYYGSSYQGQNLNRAINQLCLLDRLKEKEEVLLQKMKK